MSASRFLGYFAVALSLTGQAQTHETPNGDGYFEEVVTQNDSRVKRCHEEKFSPEVRQTVQALDAAFKGIPSLPRDRATRKKFVVETLRRYQLAHSDELDGYLALLIQYHAAIFERTPSLNSCDHIYRYVHGAASVDTDTFARIIAEAPEQIFGAASGIVVTHDSAGAEPTESDSQRLKLQSALDVLQLSSVDFKLNLLDEKKRQALKARWKLTDAELAAVVGYTGFDYNLMNDYLRLTKNSANFRPDKKSEALETYIAVATSALNKLRDYRGFVRRGVNVRPADLKKFNLEHQPGNIVSYDAFTSTSIDTGFSENMSFMILSTHGKWVQDLSPNSLDHEVLFKPGTKFKVIGREGNRIVLEELD